MMDAGIIKIREKYWAGETSLDEEKKLRQYYNEHSEEDAIRAIFNYADRRRMITYDGKVAIPVPSKSVFSLRRWMGIAASLIVLVAAVWIFNSQSSQSNEIVIEDPKVALQLTQEAFAFLNGKIDDSSSSVKHGISHLDKTFIFKN